MVTNCTPVVNFPHSLKHHAIDKNVNSSVLVMPTDWVNNLEKKNGSLQLYLGPRNLNKVIKYQHYKIPTMQGIAIELGKTVFLTLDLKDGYANT